VSGTVIKTGKEIKNFAEGDEVFGVLDNKYGGAYGQYAVGTEKCFVKRPEEIDAKTAAAIPMAAITSLQAIRDVAKLKAGQTIIVNGASGGVGHIAMQIAKIMEAKVIAVASTISETFVNQFNPNQFIDYTNQNVLELNKKVDVFFDVNGNQTYRKTRHLLKKGGKYINLNYIDSILKSPTNKFLQLFSEGKKAKTLLMKHNPKDLELIRNWVLENRLVVKIDKTFELNQIAEAHQYAEKGHSKGKNIVKMPV
jgi:NADPH:quinone reductase-like Zn-dependent oxidoreductase